MAFENTS